VVKSGNYDTSLMKRLTALVPEAQKQDSLHPPLYQDQLHNDSGPNL
jgi:hypothetical protein